MTAIKHPRDKVLPRLTGASSPFHHRQLNDEPRSSAGPILGPDPSSVKAYVLGHERKPEPGAIGAASTAGRSAPDERLEDPIALVEWHAGPGILEREPNTVVCRLDRQPGNPSSVALCILHEVDDHTLHPALVDADYRVTRCRVDLQGHPSDLRRSQRMGREFARSDWFNRRLVDAGVHARHLEEIFDQSLEPTDVGLEKIEGHASRFGEFLSSCFDNVYGGGQGRQGGAQLVADDRREPGIALDSVMKSGCHRVERVRQPVQVLIAGVLQSNVEATGPDGSCGLGRVGQRSQQSSAGPCSHDCSGEGRDGGRAGDGVPESPKVAIQLVQGRNLEERTVLSGQRHPDSEVWDTAKAEELAHRHARRRSLAKFLRDVVPADLQ